MFCGLSTCENPGNLAGLWCEIEVLSKSFSIGKDVSGRYIESRGNRVQNDKGVVTIIADFICVCYGDSCQVTERL